jgi:peptide/nickel transport system ATP-binding protein
MNTERALSGRSPALSVRDLRVAFSSAQGPRTVVKGLSFDLDPGEILGIAGESGCGKSVTAAALMGLLPLGGRADASRIMLGGTDLASLGESGMRSLRGRDISMVFQDPATALDPVFNVGSQLMEVIRRHRGLGRKAARSTAIELLDRVEIPDAARIMSAYPHELSGGMRQRVMIAMAMTARPAVLIADEPTSSLDVTTQGQVLRQLERLRRNFGTAVLLITHDLGVVAELCDRALVMYDGQIVESATVTRLFRQAAHPYTAELLNAIPRWSDGKESGVREPPATGSETLLQISDLTVSYTAGRVPGRRGQATLTAVNSVSLEIEAGSIFGLVGESGSGKTSLAHAILGLTRHRSGVIRFRGKALHQPGAQELNEARRKIQYVFQNPLAALSPRRTVGQSIREPLDHFRIGDRAKRCARVIQALDQVSLSADAMDRYPHELSGGQQQRVALARALVTGPELIIADEPVSSLDVAVQSRILELIRNLRDDLGVAFLFVSHDLAVVRQLADRVGVMYLGRMLENAPAESLFSNPAHPYTCALLDAVPVADPGRDRRSCALTGEIPSPLTPPGGCVFHTRCPSAMERCINTEPAEILITNDHGDKEAPRLIRCHLHDT